MSGIPGYMRRRWGVISILVVVLLAAAYFVLIEGSRATTTQSGPLISEALPQPAYAQTLPAAKPSTVSRPSASPAPKRPAPPAAPVVHPDAGRADPFQPLVRSQSGESQGGGSQSGGYIARTPTVPLPPPAPLPPPVFPQEVNRPSLPSPSGGASDAAPGAPAAQPQQMLAMQAQVVGLIGDIVILRLGDRTYVVRQGEKIEGRIQVFQVNAEKGLVVLMENGQRFELQKHEAPSQP